jgi:peroxiredoxin
MRSENIRKALRRLAGISAGLAIGLAANPLCAQRETNRGNYFPVDLSAVCAAHSNSPVSPSFSSLPRGTQTFGGVPFRIDCNLQVTGIDDARNGEFHPARLANIPIGRKAMRLHLLQGADHDDKDGVPLARLVFHYANGEQRATRLTYGIHVRSWMQERREAKSSLLDPDSRQAWTGSGAGAGDDTDRGNTALRLFQTALPNPLPDQEITRLELISLFSRATPFISALTLETGGPETTPLSAASSRRVFKKSLELEDSVYRAEFTIRTTDGESGRPITNASAALTIADDETSFYFGEARSDNAGVIRLPFPPQQMVTFTALVRAPGLLPFTFGSSKTNGGDFAREVEAKLARGVRIGGTVNDTKGKPIAGAEIVIHKITQTGPREYARLDYDTARTDKDGRWSSESAPADFEGFNFQVSHPDYRSITFSQAAATSTEARSLSRDDLLAAKPVMILPAALRIEGIVADDSGKPVKDVELRLVDTGRPDAGRPVKCDARGRFSVVVPQPGDISLMAQAKGYRPKLQTVTAEPDMSSVTVTLARTQPFRGRVVDQGNDPVPGARVRLDTWNGSRLLQWQTLTDEQGRFVWDSPPDGNVMFQVSATNHSSMRTSFGTPSGEHTFHLRKMSRVIGRVIDADTKKPIDDFVVVTGRAYNPDEPIRWERYDTTGGRKGEYSVRLNEYSSSGSRIEIMVEAPGYLPAASPTFLKAGLYTNDFALKKGRGISGVVQLADGSVVSNATVVLVDRSDSASMDRPPELRRNSGGEFQRSNARGQFEFAPKLEPHTIVAAHALGFAEVRASNVVATGKVVLQTWGRLKGVVRVGKGVEPDQSVIVQSGNWRYGEEGRFSPPLYLSIKADLGQDGSFSFDRVPPGERRASLQIKLNDRDSSRSTANSHGTSVEIQPGKMAEVVIGGSGRPVIGRMTVLGGSPEDVDWRRDQHTLQMQMDIPTNIPPPLMTGNMSDEERRRAHQQYNERVAAFMRTPEGRAMERKQRNYVLRFETNGTFRIDNVDPGNYYLYVSLTNPDRPDNYYEHIGSLNKNVTIPSAPASKPDEPFDLGLNEVQVRNIQRTGRPAPKFEVKTFDGRTVKLADFAGKFVLLDFWATWAGTRNLDLQMLKAVHTTYGKDNRLVMLGVNFDQEASAAQKVIEQSGIKWLQAYAGPWDKSTLPASYGVQGLPANILIDPQGKIVTSSLRGSNIRTTVRNRLGDPRSAAPAP